MYFYGRRYTLEERRIKVLTTREEKEGRKRVMEFAEMMKLIEKYKIVIYGFDD